MATYMIESKRDKQKAQEIADAVAAGEIRAAVTPPGMPILRPCEPRWLPVSYDGIRYGGRFYAPRHWQKLVDTALGADPRYLLPAPAHPVAALPAPSTESYFREIRHTLQRLAGPGVTRLDSGAVICLPAVLHPRDPSEIAWDRAVEKTPVHPDQVDVLTQVVQAAVLDGKAGPLRDGYAISYKPDQLVYLLTHSATPETRIVGIRFSDSDTPVWLSSRGEIREFMLIASGQRQPRPRREPETPGAVGAVLGSLADRLTGTQQLRPIEAVTGEVVAVLRDKFELKGKRLNSHPVGLRYGFYVRRACQPDERGQDTVLLAHIRDEKQAEAIGSARRGSGGWEVSFNTLIASGVIRRLIHALNVQPVDTEELLFERWNLQRPPDSVPY